MGSGDRPPAGLGGFDELEHHGQDCGRAAGAAGDLGVELDLPTAKAIEIDAFVPLALDHLSDDSMFRMTGTLEQNFKSVLRRNKAGGVDRIARAADVATEICQAVVSQSRYHIEG
jgi:hypothetical protein